MFYWKPINTFERKVTSCEWFKNEWKKTSTTIKLHVCFNVSVSQLVSLLFVSCTCVSIHWPVCYVGQNMLTVFRKRWRMWRGWRRWRMCRRWRRWTWTGIMIQNKQPFAESEIVLFPLGFPFSDVIKYIGNTSALCTLSMLNLLFLLK